MGQYYGVVRSSEYLAHYGVLGMRWGVRNAIRRGDTEALKRHYEKARNKLTRLSLISNGKIGRDRANASRQMKFGVSLMEPMHNNKTMEKFMTAGDNYTAKYWRKKRDKWANSVNDAFKDTDYTKSKFQKQRKQIMALSDQKDVQKYASALRDKENKQHIISQINKMNSGIDFENAMGRASIVDHAYVVSHHNKKKRKG